MKGRIKLIVLLLIYITLNFISSAEKELEHISKYKVEIKDDWFYVNSEKFFVKGINYCGWRPGESPHDLDAVDLKLADYDFRLIKEAGLIPFVPQVV